TYAWIFAIQAIAYYGKLAIHPAPLTTIDQIWERAAIGPIHGGWVVAAGVVFHAGWALFALVTHRIEVASRPDRRTLHAMGWGAISTEGGTNGAASFHLRQGGRRQDDARPRPRAPAPRRRVLR